MIAMSYCARERLKKFASILVQCVNLLLSSDEPWPWLIVVLIYIDIYCVNKCTTVQRVQLLLSKDESWRWLIGQAKPKSLPTLPLPPSQVPSNLISDTTLSASKVHFGLSMVPNTRGRTQIN